ncbi:hypothetical protein B0H19DRAFT_1079457 [Mycena capillaripes]|nr:hypothetical protein B0H19DRAFT_1079457 [Mycena capillaripes]
MWMEIGNALTADAANNAETIYARELDRLNLCLMSKWMKAVCEATPSMWRSVVLQQPRLAIKFPFTPTIQYLKKHIAMSQSKPLLIAFQLPFGRDTDDENVELLKEVMTVVDRIEEIYLVGDRACSANLRCLYSVLIEHGRLHLANQLRHPLVWMDPEPLCSLHFGPPSRPIVRVGIDLTITYQYLTYMDVLDDLSRQSMQSLVWRSMPSLLNFTIHDITILPPILAPHLELLIVHDASHPFTLSTLNAIEGNHQTSLKELDLLANLILNSEVIAVFARCSNLMTLRVCCAEVRTTLYETVKDRVYSEYWRGTKFKLHRVEFANLPPNQSRFCLPFRCWPTSPDSKQLADISGLTRSLLAIVNMEKEIGQKFHSTFTMILVTWDNSAADELIRNGLTFRGSRYLVERCPDNTSGDYSTLMLQYTNELQHDQLSKKEQCDSPLHLRME